MTAHQEVGMKGQKITKIATGVFIVVLLILGWRNNQMRNKPIAMISETTDDEDLDDKTIDIEVSKTNNEDQITNSKVENKSKIFIHITGAIVNEGLFELDEGARLNDLVKKAGGLKNSADVRRINLSMVLSDQMRIHIYEIDEESDSNIPETNSQANIQANSSKININKADLEGLTSLPGIGEKRAQQIIEYREKNKFNTVDDLKNISGIGDKIIEQIRDLIIFQ